MIPLHEVHKQIKELPAFNGAGLKQVKVDDKTWIYVEKQLTPKQVEKRIEKYKNKARHCEQIFINRNGGRPAGS